MNEFKRQMAPVVSEGLDNPYDLCLECPYRGKSCDGPNFFAMTHQRRVEWANALKKIRGLTNAQIAEQAVLPDGSKLPKATIDSVLSGRTQDVKTSTWSAILRVLVGGCWGQYPCHMAAMLLEGERSKGDSAMVEELKSEVKYLQARIAVLDGQLATKDRQIAEIEKQAADQRSTISEQNKLLKRKDTRIVILVAALVLLMVMIIAALIYDKMNPDVGWITDIAAIIAGGRVISFPYAAS